MGDDIVVLSYGQRGTLTSQLNDGRWEAQVGLIKMTLEEKEFDLVQAQQEKQVKKKQVKCCETKLLVVAHKPDWTFEVNAMKKP